MGIESSGAQGYKELGTCLAHRVALLDKRDPCVQPSGCKGDNIFYRKPRTEDQDVSGRQQET